MPQIISSSEDEDMEEKGSSYQTQSAHETDPRTAAANAPKSEKPEKKMQTPEIDPPVDKPGNAPKQEAKGAPNGLKKSLLGSTQTVKDSGAVEGAQTQQPAKRRGRPPGSKNKIKKVALEPATEAKAPKGIKQTLSEPVPPSLEPLTKRAKIQAELQLAGLQPVAVGPNANSVAVPAKPILIRRQPELQSASVLSKLPKEISTSKPTAQVTAPAAAAATGATTEATATGLGSESRENPPPPPQPPTTASAPELPSDNPNKNTINNASGHNKLDLAPGEALRTWLEENKTHVVEEKLIEELPDDIPLHQPSAEELASNAACAEFQALLAGLTSAREAISQATAAAFKVAATGASARAVRMVVDAASDATGPQERLPYLYLLDSAVKSELRQAQEQGKEGKKEEGNQPVFRRAVGAALQRLVHLLLGDDEVRKKVDKLLNIWQREGVIAASLIEPVMESLKLDAERLRKEAAAGEEERLKKLLKETLMNSVMKITYIMPNGENREVVIGRSTHKPEPGDWSMPSDLGIEVLVPPPEAARRMKFLSSSQSHIDKAMINQKMSGPLPGGLNSQHGPDGNGGNTNNFKNTNGDVSVGYSEQMSPWCREKQIYEDHGYDGNVNKSFEGQGQSQRQVQQPPPPMPLPPAQPAVEEDIEFDEFDQGILRDAYGGGAGGGGNVGGVEKAPVVDHPPLPPPPPQPLVSQHPPPFLDEFAADQWGGMPHVNNASFIAGPGTINTQHINTSGNGIADGIVCGGGIGAPYEMQMMEWQMLQQQAQAQQQEMMLRNNQMAMSGAVPMGMGVLPTQQQAMAMGLQVPMLQQQQQQQVAMMNVSMMGGNDFGGEYGYGSTGMGMMQQQQQQQSGGGRHGGRGGDGSRGHQYRHGGGNRQQPYHQQHNRHDSRNARR